MAARRFVLRVDDESGFTLAELLVVMVLFAIIGTMVTSTIVNSMAASRRGQERIYALTALETAAQRIAREIRAADPIEAADADSIDITTYRGAGRSRYVYQAPAGTGDVTETRSIFATATSDTPTNTPTARPLLRGVDQTGMNTFSYFKMDGAAWDPAVDEEAQICRVQITLVRDLPEQGSIQVQSSVYVRNSVTNEECQP